MLGFLSFLHVLCRFIREDDAANDTLGLMPHSYEEEITTADVKLIAASIYEPQSRLWIEERWQCPQCRKLNERNAPECACRISRDGLPEFVDAQGFPLSLQTCFVSFSDDQRAPLDDSDYSREPSRVLAGVVILGIPALFTWFGLIEVGLKLWGWLHG